MKSIRGRAHEGFDAQVLFDGLEEQLDLPSLFIDGGDGGRSELEMVGEELVGPAVMSAIFNQAKKGRRTAFELPTGQADGCITKNAASLRNGVLLDDFVERPPFEPA